MRRCIDWSARRRIPGRSRSIHRLRVAVAPRTNGRSVRAIELRARAGRVPYDFLYRAPEFKALAKDERYVRALAIARAQFDDTVSVLKEADARREMPPYLRQPLVDLLNTLGMSGGRRTATSQGALHGHQPLKVRRGVNCVVYRRSIRRTLPSDRRAGRAVRVETGNRRLPRAELFFSLPRLDLPGRNVSSAVRKSRITITSARLPVTG